MSSTVAGSRSADEAEDVARRLLESSARLSFDPATEVDWDAPLDPAHHGLNPEWSTLYGTPLWERMSEEQRVLLTRHEVCSIMSTGIWFEMILQQMVLREQYAKDPSTAEFQFALTEIADECRHSIMFARACAKMGATAYTPPLTVRELGRIFKTVAVAEVAYASILVAEEVLDLMQRDAMRGENVLPLVRTTSHIHVVEESRHMRFARAEVRKRLDGAGRARVQASALSVAVVAYFIVTSMVNKDVYTAAGLDADEAVRAARGNEHHKAMMRSGAANLVAFLGEVGLLTRPAMALYRRINLI
ncbi:diiron oxygenase [Streptomyces sp. DSM 44917]|uniref:Diiron oxygenase n=1 Tax=Streptomyces boetiae TaxID=3075541 RepID=A0ABU2LF18_9ACTN|nr:diiron oxygenase [Streptomyces sp. DSM 44917]MDT0310050.1 diiron oxygenase [Streptomyces sp. DSM 44917]